MKRFLLLPLVLAGGVALGQEPRKPAGLAGAGLTQAQVDASVQRGKAFLLKRYAEWTKAGKIDVSPDELLAVATLSHTDAFRLDPRLGRRLVDGVYASKLSNTYECALACMALETLGGHRQFLDRIADAAQVLVDDQDGREGTGWSYGRPPGPHAVRGAPVPEPDAPRDPVLEVLGGTPIASPGSATVVEPRSGPPARVSGDNSCSQFALMGFHSASAAGVEPPAEVWARGLRYFGEGQNADGGWGYHPKDKRSYGSMTCAGLTGLAISLGHTGTKAVSEDDRIRRGIAWLASNFTVSENPGKKAEHHYYYLYGLERVGVLLGTELVGEHEWYPEGARWLLDHQKRDGSWQGSAGAVRDTCFALLFLTRATVPLGHGGPGMLRTSLAGQKDAPREATGLYFILDASSSMLAEVGGRSKWEIVREASKKLVASLSSDVPVGLRVYGHHPSDPNKVGENETELVIPVGRLDRERFAAVVDAIKPVGRTPIAMSFDRCRRDLDSTGPRCRVLLLSDGAETGGGDPVASARALAQHLKCVAIDCLGFDLASEPKARAQLMEIALVGKGRFTESIDPEILARAGARANPAYVVLDASGKEVVHGTLGDGWTLAEGRYLIRVSVNDVPHEATVWINSNAETRVIVHPEKAPR